MARLKFWDSSVSSIPQHVSGANSPFKDLRNFLVRRRVRLTVAVFFVLIAEDLVERVQPHNLLNFSDATTILGLTLIMGGVALRSLAAGTLRKSAQLTTHGLYGLVRHPLYVGSFMMMVGFSLIIGDSENIWVVLGPILALYVYRIVVEERHLAAKFGGQWTDYASAVPRFIPRRLPIGMLGPWRLGEWLKNREYQAVGAVFAGLIAIQLWNYMLVRAVN